MHRISESQAFPYVELHLASQATTEPHCRDCLAQHQTTSRSSTFNPQPQSYLHPDTVGTQFQRPLNLEKIPRLLPLVSLTSPARGRTAGGIVRCSNPTADLRLYVPANGTLIFRSLEITPESHEQHFSTRHVCHPPIPKRSCAALAKVHTTTSSILDITTITHHQSDLYSAGTLVDRQYGRATPE